MKGRPSTYTAFRRRLITGFALLVMLLAALFCWKIVSGYDAERAAAFVQTRSFAKAMGAHVASEMHVVDLSLLRSAEAIGALDSATLQNAVRVRQILALSAGVSDANFWIHFIDTHGIGVVASNSLPIKGVAYADRSYFKAFAGGCDTSLYVGAPETGRVSHRRLFFMSRAVCTPAGEPRGVVVASVDAGAIAAVFASALFQPSLNITLLHSDGKVIARAPMFDSAFALDLSGSALYRNWKAAPTGSYEGQSRVDGQTRVFSYQTVDGFPLVIAVGNATDSWMDTARKDSAIALFAFAVIATVLVFSGRFALRSFRRVERSDASGRVLNMQLREARDEMARAAKRAHMIADSLPALVAYVDAEERYLFHNKFYRNVPGIDVTNMVGRTMHAVLGDALYLPVRDQVKQALAGQHVTFERAVRLGADERHLKYDYTPDIDDSGRIVGFYAMVLDVSASKEIEARLGRLARTDTLTGLPNRNQLVERLGEALARSRRGGRPTGCLYLDIDHFKAINDTLGHAGGDAVLREFGARLRACVRETDLVARLAGDEFVIVLEALEESDAASTVAAKIVGAMREPFFVEGSMRDVATSVGIALSTGADDDVDAVLKRADTALYEAKRAGRGGFQVFAQRQAQQ